MTAFRKLWDELTPIGRDPISGGYLRFAWSEPELACRRWFTTQAAERGMALDEDGNGNLFAWWGDPYPGDAVLTGSHFDSVPHGGGYDGPLGIVSAFLAIDLLRTRGVVPRRPLGIAAFVEEEGARFGIPCLGSRLFAGELPADRAATLPDQAGMTLREAMGAAPVGARPEMLGRIAAYLELHIEQGRALEPLGAPLGVASGIWPHGRWQLELTGQGNHAGTTRMADRRDPMLVLAHAVLAANDEARRHGGHATIGRILVEPNSTNAVPSRVVAWLDARAQDDETLLGMVAAVNRRVAEQAAEADIEMSIKPAARTAAVAFDPELSALVRDVLRGEPGAACGEVPVLPTAAGHDAGVLAGHVPTAMIFVRNPTGVSHAPTERADEGDCAIGAQALAAVLEELTCR